MRLFTRGVSALILVVTLFFHSASAVDAGTVTVAKTPSCGCCTAWIEHLEQNGFDVVAYDMTHEALDNVKRDLDIDPALVSCHTAMVDGYFIEGHVPADDITRLLQERPAGARGLSVPGMPIGSPGMEMGNQRDPFQTLLVRQNNQTEVFSTYD